MATAQKMEVTIQPRLGFWNIISSAVGIALLAGVLLFAIYKAFVWAWPTLKWFIPVTLFIAFTVWMIYLATQASDEVAHSHRQYQSVIMLVRIIFLAVIWWANTSPVVP